MAKTIVGYFDSYDQARRAMDELARQGISRDHISIITNRETYRGTDKVTEHDASGAAVGAATGAVVGGGAMLIASLIPGVGPILAAGPLLATLLGAGVGAAAGGIIGALVDAGVPEEDARLYEEGVRRGGTLLMVRADADMASRAASIMNQHGAVDIKRRSSEWKSAGAMAGSGSQQNMASQQPGQQRMTQKQGEVRVPVVEEELKVGKREASGGAAGVRVQTHTSEKPVEQKVQLHEEKVNVERRPTNRPATAADFGNQRGEESFEMREHREEPVVQKTARVVEEVVVSKEERDRTETVRDTVRRKDVEVQPIGGHRGEADDDSAFRQNFQTAYAGTGMTYEQCAPAYRYGSQLGSDGRYSGKNWNQIEIDARRDWESRSPGTWDRMKNAIRHGWDRVKEKVS